jgi:GNAT superfamily N-acetyltransferase
MIVVRAAAYGELPKFLPLLEQMHAESPMKWPEIDDQKVLAALENCFDTGAVFGAFNDNTTPVGILALAEGEHWFSHHHFLGDLVFYVGADFRASTAARRLLEEAKRLASDTGQLLLVAVVDGTDVERKSIFYQRAGFDLIGGVFAFNKDS